MADKRKANSLNEEDIENVSGGMVIDRDGVISVTNDATGQVAKTWVKKRSNKKNKQMLEDANALNTAINYTTRHN